MKHKKHFIPKDWFSKGNKYSRTGLMFISKKRGYLCKPGFGGQTIWYWKEYFNVKLYL